MKDVVQMGPYTVLLSRDGWQAWALTTLSTTQYAKAHGPTEFPCLVFYEAEVTGLVTYVTPRMVRQMDAALILATIPA